jgi:hypothetical protein
MSKAIVPLLEGEILPPGSSLEDLTDHLNQKIKEGTKLIRSFQLQCGRIRLEMRKRVEAREAGDVTWWEWFKERGPNISRKHAERWLGIASKDDPEAAALEYHERHAGHQRDYRERKKLAATAHGEREVEPEPEPAAEPEPEPAPREAVNPYDALQEAVVLKNRIVHELMPLMTASGRDQFRVVLIEDVTAAADAE